MLPPILIAVTDLITDARKITRIPPDTMIVRTRAIRGLVLRLPAKLDATLQSHMASAVATQTGRAIAQDSAVTLHHEDTTSSLIVKDMTTGTTTTSEIDRPAILAPEPGTATAHSANEIVIAHRAGQIRKILAGKVGPRRFPGVHLASENRRHSRPNSRAIMRGLTTTTLMIPRRGAIEDRMDTMAGASPRAAISTRQRLRNAM